MRGLLRINSLNVSLITTAEINVLHRLSESATALATHFFEQLAIHAGYTLDWRDIAVDVETGQLSGAMGDLSPLQTIFS